MVEATLDRCLRDMQRVARPYDFAD